MSRRTAGEVFAILTDRRATGANYQRRSYDDVPKGDAIP
jgi:hypothetical protein